MEPEDIDNEALKIKERVVLAVPGEAIEFDAREAQALGAFREDAVDETDL